MNIYVIGWEEIIRLLDLYDLKTFGLERYFVNQTDGKLKIYKQYLHFHLICTLNIPYDDESHGFTSVTNSIIITL